MPVGLQVCAQAQPGNFIRLLIIQKTAIWWLEKLDVVDSSELGHTKQYDRTAVLHRQPSGHCNDLNVPLEGVLVAVVLSTFFTIVKKVLAIKVNNTLSPDKACRDIKMKSDILRVLRWEKIGSFKVEPFLNIISDLADLTLVALNSHLRC